MILAGSWQRADNCSKAISIQIRPKAISRDQVSTFFVGNQLRWIGETSNACPPQ